MQMNSMIVNSLNDNNTSENRSVVAEIKKATKRQIKVWGRKSRNLSLWVFTNHTTTFYNLAYDTIRDVSNFETIKSCNNADLSSLQETCHSWTLLWPNSTQSSQ